MKTRFSLWLWKDQLWVKGLRVWWSDSLALNPSMKAKENINSSLSLKGDYKQKQTRNFDRLFRKGLIFVMFKVTGDSIVTCCDYKPFALLKGGGRGDCRLQWSLNAKTMILVWDMSVYLTADSLADEWHFLRSSLCSCGPTHHHNAKKQGTSQNRDGDWVSTSAREPK